MGAQRQLSMQGEVAFTFHQALYKTLFPLFRLSYEMREGWRVKGRSESQITQTNHFSIGRPVAIATDPLEERTDGRTTFAADKTIESKSF